VSLGCLLFFVFDFLFFVVHDVFCLFFVLSVLFVFFPSFLSFFFDCFVLVFGWVFGVEFEHSLLIYLFFWLHIHVAFLVFQRP
jgi:hypothetical protein